LLAPSPNEDRARRLGTDVLLATGRSVGLGAARGPAGRRARRANGDLRRAGAEILVGERKQVGGVLLPTRLEL